MPRLYTKAVFTGFKRSQRNQTNHTSLLKIEGVNTKDDAEFYLGKRVVYLYKSKSANQNGSKVRTIWGRVTRPHGSGGSVRAKFAKDLPSAAIGRAVRVMLYPSRV